MQVTTDTELMKNQKHADVMAPDKTFEVLQTTDGDAVFFSIGTDDILYATREIQASQTGWTKVDLSSTLATSHPGSTITVKAFTLSQNPQTLAFDIALILTAAGVDFLYLCWEFAGSTDAWAGGIPWTLVPFDAASTTPPNPLTIADVYVLSLPSSAGPNTQSIFVDIERDPGNPLNLLDRYYILLNSSPAWNRWTLPIDLAAGSITSSLGRRVNDHMLGIYTFGTISDTQELIFAPQTNYFDPTQPPLAARLQLPTGSTAFASAMNNLQLSNVFVAATAGLFLFTPDNQHDHAAPLLVVPATTIGTSNIFANVNTISALTDSNRTVVWALNAQGDLFHVACAAGSETIPTSWSNPLPFSSGVEGFSFYLNTPSSNNTLFAHLSGQSLTQYSQDPVTSSWSQRSLLLPATVIDDMLEYNSFTTHINIRDENLVPIPNTGVTLTATSLVTVYINDVYYVLRPGYPVDLVSDEAGVITLVQETQSLTAVSFQLTTASTNQVVPIDPLSNAMQRLSTIQSGSDLSNVQITTAQGVQKPLVPSTISSANVDAAAQSISQLLKIKATLPADGSRAKPDAAKLSGHGVRVETWGVGMKRGSDIQYVEGDETRSLLGNPKLDRSATKVSPEHHSAISDWDDGLEVAAGDLFNWLKTAWDDVEAFVVDFIGGVYHFLVRIGEAVYTAVLDTVSAVVGAVEFVFNKIEIFIEDVVAWLGFLFDWGDILRTHKVMKNIVKQRMAQAIDQVGALEEAVSTLFNSLENEINAMAGITDPGQSIGTQQQKGSSVSGQNSPQSNWAVYHTKNGMPSAATSHSESATDQSPIDLVLSDMDNIVGDEGAFLATMIQQIKEQVADQFSSLTAVDVIKKVLAIISDFLIKSAREFVLKSIDLAKVIAPTIMDLLDAPLDIPILSSIYKDITGDQLSFLDLNCLVGAIMATIVFKLISGQSPFPDDSTTAALIAAPDFATLTTLLTGNNSSTDTEARFDNDAMFFRINGGQKPLEKRILGANLKPLDITVIVFDIAALPASILVIWTAYVKSAFILPLIPPLPLRCFSAGAYFLYCGPDIVYAFQDPLAWPTITNDVITAISLFKTCADNNADACRNAMWATRNSAIFETIINLTWLAPAIGSIVANTSPKTSDWVSFGSDLAFDVGGALTVGTSPVLVPNADTRAIMQAIISVLGFAYGGLSAVTGGLLIAGE